MAIWKLIFVGGKWYPTSSDYLFKSTKIKRDDEFPTRELGEAAAKKLNENAGNPSEPV